MRVSVEVCVTSIAEALAAAKAGADSVEVCSWLACGGLTPGPGLLSMTRDVLKDTTTKRRVLVRPRPGGFHYTADERHIIMRDALLLSVADDEAGVVAGSLDDDDLVDARLMEVVKATLGDRAFTFHRAIDHASDNLAALDQCIALGAHRVLTSGGGTLALDGAAMLKKMVERAGEKLVIAAAGGIHAGNVVELVQKTGVAEVHFSAQKATAGVSGGAAMSSANAGVNFETEPDVEKIEGVLNALVKAGLR
jgi:copper homeostasis protein